MAIKQLISPCLWFDDQAQQAAEFYTGIFEDSRILGITHYGEAGFEVHGRPAGSVMSVLFELRGEQFTALNGGPLFTFNEAISLQVYCENQEQLDDYWDRLSADGDPNAQQCGWLKDKYGVSWQILPSLLLEKIGSGNASQNDRVMTAILQMKKLDIATLERAFSGAEH
ncbi:VOC family protein [Pseudomonas sp. DSP3-2-2]|uniref:VOC family protein n=1 Tax=unclassified Pseudomonas TaxID=196821 RepID=UPI003CE6EF0E